MGDIREISDLIKGVRVKSLSKHVDERGWVMEGLRRDDVGFQEFGMVCAARIMPKIVKAWHLHKKQTDNFICLCGSIKIVLYDDREGSETRGRINEFFMGDDQQILVSIPAGVFHGMKNMGNKPAMIINTATKAYDKDNSDEERVHPHKNEIPYDWNRCVDK